MIVARLEHLASNVATAVVAFDAKLLLKETSINVSSYEKQTYLVVFLAVHLAIFVEILAVEYCSAGLALETPNVPMFVQCNQRLAIRYFALAVIAYCTTNQANS